MGQGLEAGSSQVEGLADEADGVSSRWKEYCLMVHLGYRVENVKSRRLLWLCVTYD